MQHSLCYYYKYHLKSFGRGAVKPGEDKGSVLPRSAKNIEVITDRDLTEGPGPFLCYSPL